MYIGNKRYKELIDIEQAWKKYKDIEWGKWMMGIIRALERKAESNAKKADNPNAPNVDKRFQYVRNTCDDRDVTWCEVYGDSCCAKWCPKVASLKRGGGL